MLLYIKHKGIEVMTYARREHNEDLIQSLAFAGKFQNYLGHLFIKVYGIQHSFFMFKDCMFS